jgi:hypothetical protein
MNRTAEFDKALDEAFKIIIRNRLERARKQLLATAERLRASKQDRNK